MPATAIDYSKTIIYKIQHKEQSDLFYVGHTTNFESRKKDHKKRTPGGTIKLYIMIREHGGWDMFHMGPIKEVNCKSRMEALIEEQKQIDELKSTLNQKRAYNTERSMCVEKRIERMNEAYTKKQEKILKKEADFRMKIEKRKQITS